MEAGPEKGGCTLVVEVPANNRALGVVGSLPKGRLGVHVGLSMGGGLGRERWSKGGGVLV